MNTICFHGHGHIQSVVDEEPRSIVPRQTPEIPSQIQKGSYRQIFLPELNRADPAL
jgi:hypothetical protein